MRKRGKKANQVSNKNSRRAVDDEDLKTLSEGLKTLSSLQSLNLDFDG